MVYTARPRVKRRVRQIGGWRKREIEPERSETIGTMGTFNFAFLRRVLDDDEKNDERGAQWRCGGLGGGIGGEVRDSSLTARRIQDDCSFVFPASFPFLFLVLFFKPAHSHSSAIRLLAILFRCLFPFVVFFSCAFSFYPSVSLFLSSFRFAERKSSREGHVRPLFLSVFRSAPGPSTGSVLRNAPGSSHNRTCQRPGNHNFRI